MQWQVPTDLTTGAFGLDLLATATQADALTALGIDPQSLLPTGTILMWSGSIASIPAGFVLCNGANGTPDLRDRFVVGAGSTYAVDATGGASTHTHNLTISNASSGVTLNEVAQNVNADATPPNCLTDATSINDPGHTHAGSTADAGSSLPPYYALAYIMKD